LVYQVLCALLLCVIITWVLCFYGSKKRAEETRELMEKNRVLAAINDGMILGMCVVGIMFWVVFLV